MNKKILGSFALILLLGAGCSSASTADTTADTDLDTGADLDVGAEVDAEVDADDVVADPQPVDVQADAEVDTNGKGDVEVNAGTVKEFTVSGGNFAFTPSSMSVKEGDTVRITFKNEEGFHDLKLDEFNVATKQIAAGAEETVEFVASKAGSFEYYCSVGKHRAMGMVGTLMVTE